MTMTTASLLARAHDGAADGDNPAARPRRRSFNGEYKARIIAEYDALPAGSTERGALLRREGLYTSHIAEWRKARDVAGAEALAPKGRPAKRSPEQVELEKLRTKTSRLEAELARTRLALEITGKAHALLELLSESAGTETKPKPSSTSTSPGWPG
jgi:transposase